MTPTALRHRRPIRGSLKMMLGLVLLVALGMGWWASQARRQALAVALIKQDRHSTVTYSGQQEPWRTGDDAGAQPKPKPWWPPAVLERWLGTDLFRDVVEVSLGRISGTGTGAVAAGDDEAIAALLAFRRLKVLRVDFEVTDAQVEVLARLPALEDLDLPHSNEGLTDRGMRSIGAIGTLKELRVNHTAVTPAGLAALGSLDRLESLHSATMTFVPDARGVYVRPPSTTDWSPGIAALGRLPRLKVLSLSLGTLGGPALRHVGQIKSLKMIDLDGLSCPDDDLRHLDGLADLQVLTFAGTTIDGTGFRHLGGLKRLTAVILKDAPRLADPAIPVLTSLPALESAMLDGSHLTVEGLSAFRAAPKLGSLILDPEVADEAKRLPQALPKCNVSNGMSGFGGGTIGFAFDLK